MLTFADKCLRESRLSERVSSARSCEILFHAGVTLFPGRKRSRFFFLLPSSFFRSQKKTRATIPAEYPANSYVNLRESISAVCVQAESMSV